MPTAQINGFNIGTDISVTISDAFGDVLPAEALGHLTDFNWSSTDKLLTVEPIDNGGVPLFQTVWSGVSGTISFARTNGAFTQMISELMDAYHTAGLITQLTITVEVMNRDGTIDEYILTGCQLHKCSFGNFRVSKEVDFSTSFSASQLSLTGAGTSLLSALPTAA